MRGKSMNWLAVMAGLVGLIPASVQAGTKTWINQNGGIFSDVANWSPSPPSNVDDAVFDVVGEYAVHFTQDTATFTLRVGSNEVTFEMAGYVYVLGSTVTDALQIGLSSGDIGAAIVGNGELTFKNARIGAAAGSLGTLIVDGTQTIVTSTGTINVGYFGTGQMIVSSGAKVHSVNTLVGLTSPGDVVVTGAGSQWINSGNYLVGGPDLMIDTVSVEDGGTVISPTISVEVSGQIAGDSTFQGNINSKGKTAPGGANHTAILSVQGDYTQGGHSQATTYIELGGTNPGESYDLLRVIGQASLDKTLSVSLMSGFQPSPGAMFDILVAESVQGTYSLVNLPALPGGGTFSIQYLADRVRLVAPGVVVPGDCTGDGVVNVLDLLTVISHWGNCPAGAACGADLSHDNVVNVADLLMVINNWE